MVSSILRRMPRPRVERRAAKADQSGRLALDLMDVAGVRCTVDGDLPRLHGFGGFADQLNLEQAVVEGRALHLDIVRQAELPFEVPGRDPPVKELALGLFSLAALDGDDVLFGGNGNFVRRETG